MNSDVRVAHTGVGHFRSRPSWSPFRLATELNHNLLKLLNSFWVGLLGAAEFLTSAISASAGESSYTPPDLYIGVKAGDPIGSVVAQQGWYQCRSSLSLEALCFDGASFLGEDGTLTLEFLDGRAYSAELAVAGANAIYAMLRQAQDANEGNMTLASVTTTNTTIDTIKAVHDLGENEALKRFSRYLSDESLQALTGATLVPRLPPDASRYEDERSYLDSLPPGGVTFHLINFRSLDITVFRITPAPNDRQLPFPQYCSGDRCENWSIPSASVQDGNVWSAIARWFGLP